MKILYVDTSVSGHHLTYMKALSEINKENVFVLPCETEVEGKIYIYSKFEGKSLKKYLDFLKYVKKIALIEKPDIVHFLYGDLFYRYFGIGLNIFKKFKTIITFHHIRKGTLRDISIKRIFARITNGVVHTDVLKKYLFNIGIHNIEHIEYPHFNEIDPIPAEIAKEKLNLPQKTILLALGGTRYDKGLDILLEALKYVKNDFHLLIAGKEEYFTRKFIEEKTSTYRDKVTIMLEFLSDEKMALCLNSADYVVLPYRLVFDGASGPLGEAVWLRKKIIGPNHGSLGNIITQNNLGDVFESEDAQSLSKIITKALLETRRIEKEYEDYRKSLTTDRFKERYFELYQK